MKCASPEELVNEFRNARPVILVDDEGRENEGDLCLPAQFVTAEWINFMAKEARGLICLSLSFDQVERLALPLMVPELRNETPHRTAFTISIEARTGVTTGISAFDRAHTIKTAVDPRCGAADLISPGHVFPIKAHPYGLRGRQGHTEASVALAEAAGLLPGAVICEIMRDDGRMARVPELVEFAERFGILWGTIDSLVGVLLSDQKSTTTKIADAQSQADAVIGGIA